MSGMLPGELQIFLYKLILYRDCRHASTFAIDTFAIAAIAQQAMAKINRLAPT